MADPKITVGMKFSTYSEIKAKLNEKYVEVPIKSQKSNLTLSKEEYSYKKEWFKEGNGQVILKDEEYGHAKSSVFLREAEDGKYEKVHKYEANMDGFYYSASNSTGDEKFVKIVTDSQIAVDKNHNGTVDKGEIYDR